VQERVCDLRPVADGRGQWCGGRDKRAPAKVDVLVLG
jgi:hypothetical protein